MRIPVLATALLSAGLAAAQNPVVLVRLLDQAGTKTSTIERARSAASFLVSTAGITLEWTDSSEKVEVVFVLDSRDYRTNNAALARTLLAQPHQSMYSWIFFDRILRAVDKLPLSAGDLLGAVIAHELGHHLGLQHAEKGLMTANWTDMEVKLVAQGRLHFNHGDAQTMHQEIRLRRILSLNKPEPRHQQTAP